MSDQETSLRKKTRVAVLISGSGSNLQALIDAAADDDYPASIALVVSNKAEAYGLQRAARAGIATVVLDHRTYPDRAAFDAAIQETLLAHEIEIVCLAGFMRLLTPGFVEQWEGRMLNIHPSLLPDYKGLDTHARVLADGRRESGCTVHLVTADLDAGPILGQERVAVRADDTPESLQQRVHDAEHRLYPAVLRQLIEEISLSPCGRGPG